MELEMAGETKETMATNIVPLIPLQAAEGSLCSCGGPLGRTVDFVVCEHCNRLYCPDCGGPIVHGGGCCSCPVCGYGYCA